MATLWNIDSYYMYLVNALLLNINPMFHFWKESLAQVFSCEFCEISKNTFFYRTPPVAASVHATFKNLDLKIEISYVLMKLPPFLDTIIYHGFQSVKKICT